MGWAEPSTPSPEAELEKWRDAYDTLWHRARHFAGGLTKGLPSPHQLRTGQGPSDVMEALRAGHQVDVDEPRQERTL